ncbi:MAG: hypothetical protein ACLSCV_10650 [Acutalibacteraceae bacterium]
MEQVPEYVPKKKKNIFRREKINLFTDIEDEEEIIPEEVQEEQPELEDFTSKEDARSIASELRKNIRTLFLRSVVTGIAQQFCLSLVSLRSTIFLVLISALLHMQLPVWYFWNCNRRMCNHSF